MSEVTVAAGIESLCLVDFLDERGRHMDDGKAGGLRSLSKTATYFKTVKVGQIDVEKKNVDTFACEFQGLLSGDSLGDVEAGCLQNSRSRIKRSWIVVNYQNSRCCGVGHSSHLQISNSSHPAYRRAVLSKTAFWSGN